MQKKNLNAPRLNPEHIDSVIDKMDFFKLSPTLTTCVLTLKNGFVVTGESACASPENYNAELGERLAAQDARSKVWPLEAYLLKEKMAKPEGTFTIDSDKVRITGKIVEDIAKVCHEVNRAYCISLGDSSQPPWESAPDWQKKSAVNGVILHVDNPEAGPAASHVAWMKEKEDAGWTYGPEKDVENKRHHCLVPFTDLPAAQQAKDYIFTAIVAALK